QVHVALLEGRTGVAGPPGDQLARALDRVAKAEGGGGRIGIAPPLGEPAGQALERPRVVERRAAAHLGREIAGALERQRPPEGPSGDRAIAMDLAAERLPDLRRAGVAAAR